VVPGGKCLLLKKVFRYWRGSREYVVCVTAVSGGRLYMGFCLVGFMGLYGCLPVALGFGLTEVRGLEKCAVWL
jgi:hypothetical protein